VYVQGVIDQQMVDRLTPRIMLLQSASRAPITVYINSRGGNVASAELILRLLSASNQDSAPPCRIITVVVSRAASAAADLLSSGDYAIAFPESTIVYHGVRQSLVDPVTVELGSALTESLKISNEQYAMALARKAVWRFMFRFVMMKHQFPDFRQKSNLPSARDLDCFLGLVSEKLSSQAKKLVSRAGERHKKYDALLNRVLVAALVTKKATPINAKRIAQTEAAILKKIIDFEISNHKNDPGWTFSDGGLSRLSDDFFLLLEYVNSAQSDHFKRICERWGHFALTAAEAAELESISDESARTQLRLEKVRPQFQPLWTFFVALCHALQEGENDLAALDAFWLGLIDEVVGENLDTPRLLVEFQQDAPEIPQIPQSAMAAAAT
jgi:hypothetical protein